MKKFLSLVLALTLIMSVFTAVTTVTTVSAAIDRTQKELKLWYSKQAPLSEAERGVRSVYALAGSGPTNTIRPGEDYRDTRWIEDSNEDTGDGWESYSLPLGNGVMGVNVFGRTATERLQITEPSLFNPYPEGLGNFSETYIDFGHDFAGVSNYERNLIINDALANVEYTYGGVTYTRELLTSYPDKVMAIKLTASGSGNLTFTLRPTIPHLDSTSLTGRNSTKGKSNCSVVAGGDTITLSGKMNYFGIDFEGQYKVIPVGGTMTAANPAGGLGGQITVTGANEAVILVAIGSNYKLDPKIFTIEDRLQKLAGNGVVVHNKVTGIMTAAAAKPYADIKAAHLADYREYFNRVNLDLGGVAPSVPTNTMLTQYKNGTNYNKYLEELFFQYGRYLLISASREGGLPANLQGIWNRYEQAAWSGGYWHNINIQMNYWSAFSTNLADMFKPYVAYNQAYMEKAKQGADFFIGLVNKTAQTAAGTNGWIIGTGCWPFAIEIPYGTSPGHSGPGTGYYTGKMFWDYYDFTRDATVLSNLTWPIVSESALFYTKAIVPFGDKLLIENSASPEQYFACVGCSFDQQMVYESFIDTQKAAAAMGIPSNPLLTTIGQQINRVDPIMVGGSGQIKEFREENLYGEFGDPHHRHTAQLAGLYPGTQINSSTPAWIDAAKVTLLNREGVDETGWGFAYDTGFWARIKDGNKAYDRFQKLLKDKVLPNLWGMHPPFQIDANFGGTSAVTEMLLQSQEGYIVPMAAIPDAWVNGHYSGLIARGNFEVSAQWANNQAQTFEIKSNKGGECKVKYFNIENATITPNVPLTKTKDMITFDTTAGTTYVISNIPAFTKVANPTFSGNGLTVSADYKTATLEWNAAASAASYNIYIAVGSAPDYTLIENVDASKRTYEYDIPAAYLGKQATYKITAVAANGRESTGITKTFAVVAMNEWVKVQWNDYESIKYFPNANAPGVDFSTGWGDKWNSGGYLYTYKPGNDVALEFTFTGTGVRFLRDNSNWGGGTWYLSGVRFYLDGAETPYATIPASLSPGDGKYTAIGEITGLPKAKHTLRIEFDENKAVENYCYCKGFEYLPNEVSEPSQPVGQFFGDDLHITIPYVDGADSYKIYKLNKSYEYELIQTSKFEFTVIENADDKDEYGVSTMFGIFEGAIIPLEIKPPLQVGAPPENLFLGKPIIDRSMPDGGNVGFTYENLVDGDMGTRFAAWDETLTPLVFTIDLQNTYALDELKIYEFSGGLTRSDKTTIEVWDGKNWITIIDKQSLASNPRGTTTFNMGDVIGSKVRFTFVNPGTAAGVDSNQPVTLWEITCSPSAEQPVISATDKFKLLDALTGIENFYDYDFSGEIQSQFDAMSNEVRTVLGDFEATQSEIDAAVEKISEFLDIIKSYLPCVKSVTVGTSDVTVTLREDDDLIGKTLILAFYMLVDGEEKLVSVKWQAIDDTFSAEFIGVKPAAYTKVKVFVWESLLNLKPYGIGYSN